MYVLQNIIAKHLPMFKTAVQNSAQKYVQWLRVELSAVRLAS